MGTDVFAVDDILTLYIIFIVMETLTTNERYFELFGRSEWALVHL